MPNSAKTVFQEIDQSFAVDSVLQGIAAVSLQTLRGPYGYRDEVFTSFAAFKAVYGGEITTTDGPTLVKRAIERGAAVRVNKVGNYQDNTDPNTLTATKAEPTFTLGQESAGAATAQVSQIALAGTTGTAWVTCRGVRRLATFNTSLTQTGDDFVTAYAAQYLAVGITVTNSTGTLVFTAALAGQKFDEPTIGTASGDLTGTPSTTTPNNENSERYFYLTLKYEGADYNNLTIATTAASNGDSDSFDISITHANDSSINESYTNLKIVGNPTVGESDYLDIIKTESLLVDVEYADCSGFSGQLRPDNVTAAVIYGTNGLAVADTDYVGSAAGMTGFYGFDNADDFEAIAALDNSNSSVNIGAASYAASREDCVAFIHLNNTNDTVAKLQTERALITTDTRYMYIVAGGLKIDDPFLAGSQKEISELGDVIGAAMRSSAEFGPWWSFAGPNRGQVYNALGVVNNFTTTANLDLLAQRQINVVKNTDGRILISGNFSGQLATSRKSFINVVKLLIYIRKALRPILENNLEEPNDFATFRKIFGEVEPFFEDLKGSEKRALVDYNWKGDQYANKDSDLIVNTRANLDQGKYRVELYLKEIVSLQELTVSIISAPSGISFEDNLN